MRNRSPRFSSPARRLALAACAFLAVVSLVSCENDFTRMLNSQFSLEERARKAGDPRTIDELKAAIAKYSKDIELVSEANSKVAMYWRLLATRYLERNLYGDAYEAATKALTYYSDNSGLFYIVGVSAAYLSKVALVTEGQGQAKREEWLRISLDGYLAALNYNERSLKSLYGIAILYAFELGRPDLAIPYVERFLAISTKDIDAMFLYARCLYAEGRFDEAIAAYDKIISTTKLKDRKQQAEANKKRILDEVYGG